MILSNNAKERLIIALDYNNIEDAIKLIDELEDEALIYKVGLELFLNTKGSIIDYLVSKNKKIFLDLKFHDIPNTTAMASVFASKQNIFMFNVHSSGGRKMMQKCVDEIKKVNDNTLLIGVTVLTTVHTPLFCGDLLFVCLFNFELNPFCKAGAVDFVVDVFLPFLTN